MADNNSFDIVSEVDYQEVSNAVNQAIKEVSQRFDLKSSNSEIMLSDKEHLITIVSQDEYTIKSVTEVIKSKMVKRKVPLKALNYGDIQDASSGRARQIITIQNGISKEKAKDIVKDIKNLKMKVQSQIQEDKIRVTAKKIDDLQSVMKFLKEKDYDIHLAFKNYR